MRVSRLFKFLPVLAVLAMAGILAAPKPAQAHGRFGVVLGVPSVFIAPPFYYPAYPAPVYVAPPPVYYAPAYVPPAYAAPAPAGFTCYATPYVCPLQVAHPVGGPCACPAYGGGAVSGTVR